MKRVFLVALMLCAACAAQQQGTPPPHDMPSTPPRDEQPVPKPDQRHPGAPDSRQTPTTEEVQAQIQDKLASEPGLMGMGVKATVDDRTVVLTGAVENDHQHELALRIAASYAGGREIVDNIETRGRI